MNHEIFTAWNTSGRSSELAIIKHVDPFCYDEDWAREYKASVSLAFPGRPRTKLEFIEKIGTGSAEENIKAWEACKKAGLPVVPTMRETSRGSIIMTNVKADGSEVFGKYLLKADDPCFNKSLVQKFVQIDLEKLRYCAQDLGNKAADHGIMLPYDDAFEVLVHPDGSWGLIILDLSYLYPGRKVTPYIRDSNSEYIRFAYERILKLREKLSSG